MRQTGRGPEKIDTLIVRTLSPSVGIAMTMSEVCHLWPSVVGVSLGNKSYPASLEDGVLVVTCQTPGVAKVINMKGGTVTSEIRRRWGLNVTRLRVDLGSFVRTVQPSQSPSFKMIYPSQESIKTYFNSTSKKIDRRDVAQSLACLMAVYALRFPDGDDNRKGD
ncbi:MAG: hypothetical protein CSA35_02585 [Dethiosulfovibrio peptidovorans]|nr:MAG: hypothetical protein CSA35_02585 [Dethiosulfovibrio peptidovorans]